MLFYDYDNNKSAYVYMGEYNEHTFPFVFGYWEEENDVVTAYLMGEEWTFNKTNDGLEMNMPDTGR